MNLDDLGLDAARLSTGFLGGVAHVFTIRDFDLKVIGSSVVVGTLTANFLGPAAVYVAPKWLGNFAPIFIVGYCAILILQGVEIFVRNLMKKYANDVKSDPTRLP